MEGLSAMLGNTGRIIGDYAVNLWEHFKWFFYRNMESFGNILIGSAPFVTGILAAYMTWQRGYLAFGGEYVLALLMLVIGSVLRYAGETSGQGNSIPLPPRRYTERDPHTGNVTIDENDLNEIILYLGDLEDHIEATGRVNWR